MIQHFELSPPYWFPCKPNQCMTHCWRPKPGEYSRTRRLVLCPINAWRHPLYRNYRLRVDYGCFLRSLKLNSDLLLAASSDFAKPIRIRDSIKNFLSYQLLDIIWGQISKVLCSLLLLDRLSDCLGAGFMVALAGNRNFAHVWVGLNPKQTTQTVIAELPTLNNALSCLFIDWNAQFSSTMVFYQIPGFRVSVLE